MLQIVDLRCKLLSGKVFFNIVEFRFLPPIASLLNVSPYRIGPLDT